MRLHDVLHGLVLVKLSTLLNPRLDEVVHRTHIALLHELFHFLLRISIRFVGLLRQHAHDLLFVELSLQFLYATQELSHFLKLTFAIVRLW